MTTMTTVVAAATKTLPVIILNTFSLYPIVISLNVYKYVEWFLFKKINKIMYIKKISTRGKYAKKKH